MRIKALKQTLKLIIITYPLFFVLFFFLTMLIGERQNDNPYGLGSAPNKWNPYTFRETIDQIPNIFFVTLSMNIIFFPIQYEQNLYDLKKQAKPDQDQNKDEGDII